MAETLVDAIGGFDIVRAHGARFGDFPKCPACGSPVGKRQWLPPYRIELETWGSEYGDADRVGDELVISERLTRLCRDHNVRGIGGFEPVEIIKVVHRGRKIRASPPTYFKARVELSPTTVDQEASGYEWGDKSQRCPVCLWGGDVKRYARVVIDESTWDGNDVFWPRGGPCMIATESFKHLCEEHSIRNVVFGSLDDESYDFVPWESRKSE